MRAKAIAFLALGLPIQATGFNLDPCSSKPTFTAERCKPGSALACWSRDASVGWRCWRKDWAPAWSLTTGSAAANAECMSLLIPNEFAGILVSSAPKYYDGACTLEEPDKVTVAPTASTQHSWKEAQEQAEATVKLMNSTEKRMLMLGVGWYKTNGWYDLKKWWYVGNTAPIPRLGIPSLNMQDASSGFRAYWNELVGTVTCWPSLLALSATWDPMAVEDFAKAVGDEFVGKGANAILGPGVNVQRVARNGRNFEYLSGEDPFLGSVLAPAYIRGVQSKNLIAVLKHWVFNEQETHRATESSIVDAKTAWEIYYPPFQAAVDAGVDAVMCSYNRVNGVHSCTSAEQLKVLKHDMGFQGFVQSDWWATHHTSINEGLDQDMPGTPIDHFTDEDLARHDQSEVDDSVVRILSAIYRANLTGTTKCAPPDCEEWYTKNVTSVKHAALARSLAAESIVLLQNRQGLLPLSKSSVKTLAIVGAAANASVFNPAGVGQGVADAWRLGDYYSGGGSGHIVAGYVVSALDGISGRATAEGMDVLSSTTNDAHSAVDVASKADVTIVVGGTWSGEAKDRDNLSLDGEADSLIAAVAKACQNTIVIMQAPGAVVMPWRDSVSAILVMFPGGQETGNAWASVLFGDHAPTGRLPLMMPATEADTIAPDEGDNVHYSERMSTSYRNPEFKAAFPFGHGLTYTTFEYLAPTSAKCGADLCVEVSIRNAGSAAGRTVAQLYVEFPYVSGHPAPFLKGFDKTPVLLPNETGKASFRLTDQDLSYYDEHSSAFVKTLAATALIGESSADIRQKVVLLQHSSNLWAGFLGTILFICAVLLLVMLLNQFGLFDKERRMRRSKLLESEDELS